MANDDAREMSAVAIASHAWLSDEPGFWGMKREEAMATAMKAMIGAPAKTSRRASCLEAGAVRRNYEAIASRFGSGLAVMLGLCERM